MSCQIDPVGTTNKKGAVLFCPFLVLLYGADYGVRTMGYGLFHRAGTIQRVGTPLSAIVCKWVGAIFENAKIFSPTSAHMGQGRDLGMESFPDQATEDPWGRLCISLSR